MRAINHALTGAVIGLAVPTPVIAMPLAILSHYACDAIPHYGPAENTGKYLRSRRFAIGLLLDAVACGLLVLLLGIASPAHWWLAAICAFLAALPDVAFLPGWIRTRRGQPFASGASWHTRFASRIQWFERPIGGLVEVAWFGAFVAILITYL